MALGGSYQDLNIRKYTDMILHELQQNESRLFPIATVEQVEGERTYFNKTGKASSRIRTARLEKIVRNDRTYERRFVSPVAIDSTETPYDMMDADRWARDPQPEVLESMAKEMQRQKDVIILNGLTGNAAVETNGVIANVGLNLTDFNVAVNTNTYTDLTGDTGLHEGKILVAKEKILAAYGMDPHDVPFVIGSVRDLTGLQSRAFNSTSGASAGFFQGLPKINGTGLFSALDGFLGCRYIAYEELGVDTSGDRQCYMVAPGALKLGIWRDLSFKINEVPDLSGIPLQLHAQMSIGALRMYEEKVVRILCDPNNAYATQ